MNNPGQLKRPTLPCSLCCLLLAFSLTTAAADPAPCKAALTPYEATYTTVYKDIHMEGSRSLRRQDDGQFILSSSAKKIWASLSEQSVFTLVDNRIRVDKYDMSSSVLGIKREYHSMYDWKKGNARITGSANVILPLDRQPLDLLSYQLALSCDLEQGQQQVSYPVIAKKRIKDYSFKVQGKETLNTELGELETLIVDRLRKNSQRSTRIWIAPELNYLLVKMEQFEAKDKASYRLEIRKVTFN